MAIERATHAFGTSLSLKPFPARSAQGGMEIRCEIHRARDRGPEVRFWLSGTPLAAPMRVSDLVLWVNALRSMIDEAQAAVQRLKSKPPKPSKKKRARTRKR